MSCATTWQPVVAADALRAGQNIVAALVQGQALALWRSSAGAAQAWEDRCPHRGMRLSLGRIVRDHLSCAYHGWEYAANSGRCVAIPALPALPRSALAGKVCVKTFPVHEAHAMVWVRLDGDATPTAASAVAMLPDAATATAQAQPRFICSLGVYGTAQRLQGELARHGFVQQEACVWHGALAQRPVHALTLQANHGLCFVHLWLAKAAGGGAPAPLFAAVRRLRADIEAAAGEGCSA